VRAFAAVKPHLRRMLAAANLPRNRRVSAEAIAEVGAQLAYRYDPARRGYVDETVDQLADDLGIPRTKVLRVLPVLDALGLWVVTRRGGSRDGYASRRIPGPELCATAHSLGLSLSTPQTRLDLGPELSAPVRSDRPELSAPVRSVARGTQRTLHRNSAHFAPELSALVRSSYKPKEPKTPLPPAETTHVATESRRMEEVAEAYAMQALATRSGPPLANRAAWLNTCRQTALDHPKLLEYLRRFPDAPADSVAWWLTGNTRSMQYQREVS
jgi:hypothetical protein